jgi:hypothetical protein
MNTLGRYIYEDSKFELNIFAQRIVSYVWNNSDVYFNHLLFLHLCNALMPVVTTED